MCVCVPHQTEGCVSLPEAEFLLTNLNCKLDHVFGTSNKRASVMGNLQEKSKSYSLLGSSFVEIVVCCFKLLIKLQYRGIGILRVKCCYNFYEYHCYYQWFLWLIGIGHSHLDLFTPAEVFQHITHFVKPLCVYLEKIGEFFRVSIQLCLYKLAILAFLCTL